MNKIIKIYKKYEQINIKLIQLQKYIKIESSFAVNTASFAVNSERNSDKLRNSVKNGRNKKYFKKRK